MAEMTDDILLSVGLDIDKVKAELNELSKSASKIEKQLSSSKEKIQKESIENVAAKEREIAKVNYRWHTTEIKQLTKAKADYWIHQYKIEKDGAKKLASEQEKHIKYIANLKRKLDEAEYSRQVALLKKKKEDEQKAFSHSAKGDLSNEYGTTLGHKAVTTSQYMAIGAAIYGVTTALKEVTAMSIEYDNALFQNMAVLQLNRQESASLLDSNYDVAISYGVVVEELNKATITLGRAGIAYSNLAEATRVTAQLAKITGDSLDKASEVVSTFTIAYTLASDQVHILGNELAYAANASRLSIEDLGTMSNYAIAGAKTLGLTKEAVLALATSFSNIGISASTIGTQIRKFGKLVRDEAKSADKFFGTIGIKQKELAKGLKGVNSDEDFLKFVKRVGDMTDDAYEKATSGMEILTKQFVDSIRISSGTIENHLSKIKDSGDTLEAQARIQALSIEGLWNSAVATVDKAASGIATSIADMFTDRKQIELYTNMLKYLKKDTEAYIKVQTKLKAILDIKPKEPQFNTGKTEEETLAIKKKIKALQAEKEKQLEIAAITKKTRINRTGDKLNSNKLTNDLAEIDRQLEAVNKQLLLYSQQKAGVKGNTIIDSKLLEQLKKAEQGLKLLKNNIPEDRLKLLREESEKLKNTWIELDTANGDTNKILKAKLDYINAEKKATVVQNSLLNEQIALRKKLTKEIASTSSQSPESKKYDSFVAKYDEEKRAAKGNKETLLLIDKWYQQQLYILNQEEIAKFEKKSQRELEIKSKLSRADIENKYAKQSNGITDEVELLELKKQKILEILAIDVTAKGIKNDLINLSKVDADITEQKLKNEQDYNNFIMSADTDILDSQIALAESGMDWSNSLSGVAGQLQNVAKSFNNINVVRKKGAKEALSIDNKYFKEYQKYAKKQVLTEKDKQEIEVLGNKQTEEINANKLATQQAEIAGYANLAGAMVSAFEQGSDGAIAMAAVQSALGIVSAWTAIAQAWALPFPANLGAVAMVTSAVMPIINQLGGSAGSASSVGATEPIDYEQQRTDDYSQKATDFEDANKPITDRLDRQIQLLEKVSGLKNTYGDVIELELEKSLADYSKNITSSNIENLGLVNGLKQWKSIGLLNDDYIKFSESKKSTDDIVEQWSGLTNDLLKDAGELVVSEDYMSAYGGTVSKEVGIDLDEEFLSEGTNFIELIERFNDAGQLNILGITPEEYDKIMNDAQQATADFVDTTLDGLLSLVDVSKSFKELADDLRGDDFYKNQDLQKAVDDVNSIYGTNYSQSNESDFVDMLDTSIEKIQLLEDNLSNEDILLLQSQNPDDIVAQSKLISTLNDDLLDAMNSGALETINYKDSIELVAQSMITSDDNIKSWIESSSQDDAVALAMMNEQGYTLAESFEGLDNIFLDMSNDIDGLNDSELEALNANKDLLESYQDLNKGIEESIISTTESILNSLNGSTSDTNALLQFQTDLANAMNATDRSEVQNYLDDASNYTESLKNAENFQTQQDMLFAQAVATNQLTSIEDTANKNLEELVGDLNEQLIVLTDVTIQQANEIKTLRKDSEDQTQFLSEIQEQTA